MVVVEMEMEIDPNNSKQFMYLPYDTVSTSTIGCAYYYAFTYEVEKKSAMD